MRKLAKNDFYWLLQATDKVSRDVNMRNLGETVCLSENEIDLEKVESILEMKLFEILKKHVQILTTWEINFNLYGENNVFSNGQPILSQFKLKKARNTLLQAIMESLKEHEDTCAIQVFLRNIETDTYANYVFYVS